MQDVLQVVKKRPDPGRRRDRPHRHDRHARNNVELGLRRANAVRTILVDAGLARSAIAVASHGEAALLVRTADGVFEPRNRRVEITVR